MSPGTSSLASISCSLPFRMTVAFGAIPALSWATMSPACFSWYHPTKAFRARIPICEKARVSLLAVVGERPETHNDTKVCREYDAMKRSVCGKEKREGRRRTDPVCKKEGR